MATVASTRGGLLRRPSKVARMRMFGYLLLAPAIIYILALVAVPFGLAIWYSLSNVTVDNQGGTFVGLRNFVDLLGNETFQTAMRNTLLYTLASIVINSVLGTLLAFILLDDFPGKRIVRFLILLPWTIPIALTILSWKWMFDSQYSVINWIGVHAGIYNALLWISSTFNIGALAGPYPINWLGRPDIAMGAVIAVNVWRNFPFAAIILLAGLTSIPPEIIDAARIDGARAWTRYTKIIVPMIAPILFIGLLFNIIFTITDLTIVYLLTKGGPANATLLLSLRAFQVGIDSGDLGRGAAIALFFFPVLLVFAIIFLRSLQKREA